MNTSIPDWIIEYPKTSAVFAQLGLDTSCGGKSLEYMVLRHDLNPQRVMDMLLTTIRRERDDRAQHEGES